MDFTKKYRPKTLDRVVGNVPTIKMLTGMLADVKKCPHSFLLAGETGCGKTTIARIIARKIGCDPDKSDYSEYDFAKMRGIDTVREIINQAYHRPMDGEARFFVLDEFHKATNDAQNALLKILEEPPSHVYFVLCTTEPQKLIKTVIGRCTVFNIKPLTNKELTSLITHVLQREKESLLDDEVLEVILKDSLGRARNALKILQQVLAVAPEDRLKVAQHKASELAKSVDLCRKLMNRSTKWAEVNKILNSLQDEEPESIRRSVLGYASKVLLSKDEPLAGLVMEEFIEPTYNNGFNQIVYASYSVIKNR